MRYDRHLAGFENRLKDEDHIKDKIAESPGIPGKQSTAGADVTYYVIVDDLSSRDRPAGVLRRSYRDGGRRDEAFTRDHTWQRSSLLISAERGDLENDFVEITADEAGRIVDRIGQSVTGRPETMAVSAPEPAEPAQTRPGW